MNPQLMSGRTAFMESPLGCLALVSDEDAITGIHLLKPGETLGIDSPDGLPMEPVLEEAQRQLSAYFRGDLRHFDLPLNPAGTEFQRRVWEQLRRIPYGTTISYGELAARVGNPNASRAVGLANGRNPIMIVIPCHRVIGASGKLTGFSAGFPVKERLLSLERAGSTTLNL